MRTVELGGRTFDIKAGPLSIFYFNDEFGSSILTDYAKIFGGKPEDEGQEFYESLAQFDWPSALRVTWALAKTATPKDFPPFPRWIGGFEYLNMGDSDFVLAVLEEATHGLFRKDDPKTQEPISEAASGE